MSYTTAVTDRAASDVTTPTSKGYFNVADWTRIYRNAQLAASVAEYVLSTSIVFNEVTVIPTTLTIPSVTDFNTLLANIERLRLAVVAHITSLVNTVKNDWVAGAGEQAPSYTDVNLWESVIDAVWVFYSGSGYPICPTLSADLVLTGSSIYVAIDCIDAATFKIDLSSTSKVIIL
jgi:hypothetical protein